MDSIRRIVHKGLVFNLDHGKGRKIRGLKYYINILNIWSMSMVPKNHIGPINRYINFKLYISSYSRISIIGMDISILAMVG